MHGLQPVSEVSFAGHTHAGQYYVLVPLISWLLPYFHGLYDIGHGKLLVSAGTLFQASQSEGAHPTACCLAYLVFKVLDAGQGTR